MPASRPAPPRRRPAATRSGSRPARPGPFPRRGGCASRRVAAGLLPARHPAAATIRSGEDLARRRDATPRRIAAGTTAAARRTQARDRRADTGHAPLDGLVERGHQRNPSAVSAPRAPGPPPRRRGHRRRAFRPVRSDPGRDRGPERLAGVRPSRSRSISSQAVQGQRRVGPAAASRTSTDDRAVTRPRRMRRPGCHRRRRPRRAGSAWRLDRRRQAAPGVGDLERQIAREQARVAEPVALGRPQPRRRDRPRAGPRIGSTSPWARSPDRPGQDVPGAPLARARVLERRSRGATIRRGHDRGSFEQTT